MAFIELNHVQKSYPEEESFFGRKRRKVLRDISLTIQSGEILGLLGESGSGKSTLSRCILGTESIDQGSILIKGLEQREWLKQNPGKCSIVFQDYTTSVNPTFRVHEIIQEGLRVSRKYSNQESDMIGELMDRVELPRELLGRRPHELSGGQLQRVCIARALASRPHFIVFDEAISALDVSIQAQIVQLLKDVKSDEMTYLFITHDIQMVPQLCDRFLVLRQGQITDVVTLGKPFIPSPYLEELLSSTVIFESHYGAK